MKKFTFALFLVVLAACVQAQELGNQLSPLAVEVGNDNIRGFLELGFGIQGIVNVGLSHRF